MRPTRIVPAVFITLAGCGTLVQVVDEREAPVAAACVQLIYPSFNGQEVRYGAAHGQLLFVIFEVFPTHEVGVIESDLTPIIGRRSHGLLRIRRGSEETETPTQLFECVNGRYEENATKVSRQQFEAFLHSEPAEYSIKALLRFVGRED